MKRAAVVGFLVLCLVGVVYLLLETSRERSGRRGGLDDRNGERAATTPQAGASDDADEADAKAGRTAPAVDDDLNRIDGPDQRVHGRVVHAGAGVAGAAVTLYRAHPRVGERLDAPPPPIVTGPTDDGGRFELAMPRRERVIVQAAAPGLGFVRRLVFLPAEGDPDEIVLVLGDGLAVDVLVVAANDEPVASARVRLRVGDWRLPPLEREARTDEAGRCRFDDLGATGYSAYVHAEGYPDLRRYVRLPGQTHVRFVLAAGGAVFGMVRTHDGAPVAGAEVALTTRDEASGQSGEAKATTDAAGAYRAANLAPGYVSSATVTGPAFGRQSIELRPVDPVVPGGELEFDIRLPPGAPVTGRTVHAGTGAPVAGARVTLLRMNDAYRGLGEVSHVTSDAEGTFRFPFVTDGTYALEALGDGVARRVIRWSGQRPLTIDFYADGATSPPAQRVELTGTGEVHAQAPGFDYETARRANFNLQGTDVPVTGEIDDAGTVLFTHVPPAPEATVRTYNPPLQSEPFAVRAGEVTRVTIDTAAKADFTGVVVDETGAPIEGAFVQAFPEARLKAELASFLGRGNNWQAAITDQDGRFRHTVQPYYRQAYGAQQYTLVGFDRDHLAASVTGLKLPPEGETVERRLVLRRGGAVSGRVRFADGRPGAGLLVYAAPKTLPGTPHEARARRQAYADFDGRFVVEGIGEGAYSLSAYHADGRTEPVEAQAGATDVELVIEPTASLGGIVVDEDGAPVTQGRVAAIVPAPGGKESKRYGNLQGGGRFRITHLDPGAYAIEVSPQASWGTSPAFLIKRIPPVPTGTHDVVIEVETGTVLEGKVRGANGRPLAGAGVIAMPVELAQKDRNNAWNVARPTGVTNGHGEFRLKGVGDEEVEVLLIASGHRLGTARAIPGGAPVELRLERGAVLELRLLRPDGKPLSGQWFNVNPVDPKVQQEVMDLWQRAGQTYSNLGGWQIQGGTTDATGTARLTSLFPGEYTLSLQAEAGALPPTKLRTDGGTQTVRLLEALDVRGRVTDTAGRPIVAKSTNTVWVTARDANGMSRGASAGSDGSFRIPGLAAGPVKISAWAQGYKPVTVDAVAGDQAIAIQLEEQ